MRDLTDKLFGIAVALSYLKGTNVVDFAIEQGIKFVTTSAIRKYFSGSDDVMKFAMHYTTNPLIEIDGDTATGQLHSWQPMVLKENTQPFWLMAQYNDQFVRQGNKWLIKKLVLTTKSFTPHDTEFGV